MWHCCGSDLVVSRLGNGDFGYMSWEKNVFWEVGNFYLAISPGPSMPAMPVNASEFTFTFVD